MGNPKRRHTRMRRDMRRANWKAPVPGTSLCQRCGADKLPHRVCPSCGFYRDELVVVRKEKGKEGK